LNLEGGDDLKMILILPLFLALVGGCNGEKPITIGASATDSIVSELYAQGLENAGYRVTRRYDAENGGDLYDAFERGEIDLYTGFFPSGGNRDAVILNPLPADSGWALAVLRETSEKWNVTTLEDLRRQAGNFVFAVTKEFLEDAEGFDSFKKEYGAVVFKKTVTINAEDLHMPFHMGEVQVIPLRRDDGHLSDPAHRLLEDTPRTLKPRHLSPLLRRSHAEAGEAADIINNISAGITGEELIALNAEVTLRGKPSPQAARDFLKRRGFIK
jgi:glycine betaine/choline ABC-type transport system substrate-binding protein